MKSLSGCIFVDAGLEYSYWRHCVDFVFFLINQGAAATAGVCSVVEIASNLLSFLAGVSSLLSVSMRTK
jgi:hypothetical protein